MGTSSTPDASRSGGAEPAPLGSPPPAGSRSFRPWLRENLERSLPFVLAGAVCIVLAAWLALGRDHALGVRESFIALLAAVGVTLSVGGAALTLVEEPEPELAPPPGSDLVLVPRAEWEEWQRDRSSRWVAAPAPARPPVVSFPRPAVAPAPGPAAPPRVTLPVDAASVARASQQLLSGSQATTTPPAVPPVGTSVGAAPAPPAVPKAAAGPPSPTPASVKPPAGVRSPVPPPVIPPPAPPIWQEEPIHELESVLAELQRDGAALTAKVPRREPVIPSERCVGCGGEVTAYSELVCVVCGHPLCDTCLEQSVMEQRPAICPKCAPPVPG